MIAGPWSSRDEFEEWWDRNGMAHNRLAVTDPKEWERVAKIIETFQRENPR